MLSLQGGTPPSVEGITVVVVNFRTLRHTRSCITSLRAFYPTIPLLVVDNGSADESVTYLREFAAQDSAMTLVENEANLYHGPAMHQAMQAATTDHVFLLDSDCEVRVGGFLEPLLRRFLEDPLVYAIGKRGWTNWHGYAPVDRRQPHTAYVHPFACLVDRLKYQQLAPFVHHGAPLWRNMWSARRAGFLLEHVPIEDYLVHHGEVTASVHGYGYDRVLQAQMRLDQLESRAWALACRLRGREPKAPPLPPDHLIPSERSSDSTR